MELITKIGSKNFKIDLSQNRITFLDNRFYFDNAGVPVPSVTSILDCYPKGAAFYDWLKKNGEDSDTIRDEAGNRGSIVHNLTERYDAGEEICLYGDENVNFKMAEWAMFERYIEFRERFPFEVIHSELSLASAKLGFAGTLDRVIEMNGEKYLIDIKTSGSIWPSYWLQLAAYEKLLTGEYGYNPIHKTAILWLNAKTKTDGKVGTFQGKGWQLIIKDNLDKEWQLFLATFQLWKAENEGAMPRQLSYQLKHRLKLNGAI
jgi:hypothetical protein